MDYQLLAMRLDALVIFRALLDDPVIAAMSRIFHTKKNAVNKKISAYCDMVAALYNVTDDLTDYIIHLVLEDENAYIRRIGSKSVESACMDRALAGELNLLGQLATMTPDDICASFDVPIGLAGWRVHPINLIEIYRENAEVIDKNGYGIYARYHMFTLGDNGELVPVQYPDPIRLEDMVGYERERNVIIENTKSLLMGKYAANVLLCGDAGTGKSATVKAIANRYAKEGLRLVELQKNELRFLPKLMNMLCQNPLKFIFFVDDLTFSEDSPDFGTLKAILEGSCAARAQNTVIYATSNRRHLIKETADDGSDMHRNDTLQERVSLSERFGISVTFLKPEKKLYLEIVNSLAKEAGIDMPEEELALKAEQFAMQKYGRSARAARQFIEQLSAQM